MLKIITALNGRDERTRSAVIMMSSFEINLVCDLFMSWHQHFLHESYGQVFAYHIL